MKNVSVKRRSFISALLLEAGGLLLFWGCDIFGYDCYVLILVVVFVFMDGVRRWLYGLKFPRVWCLFNSLALALTILDIAAQERTWAALESVAANVLIACMFVIGAIGTIPLVQDIAEQRQGKSFPPERHDLTAFFRAYTWVWAVYFLLRAIAWLWLLYNMPVKQAHTLQSIIGPVSLFVMIALSFRGQSLFQCLNKAGLFKTDHKSS
ncbi:hypothetical protein [Acetobacter thailandicus]|uniref:hypothetical protein n=1 Tax=Acetobacter thailandicus TaxID=1502842 RepID=UPI001BA94F1A|nr:hypothetical protein [Acetobacter thailandicus]MBS0961349.1 hypothetical protein [Acetobacter thailandicus]